MDLNRQFSKENIQKTNKHMGKYSISLIIRKMHINITVGYDFTPTRMGITKNTEK
jgi:hypothetical protein